MLLSYSFKFQNTLVFTTFCNIKKVYIYERKGEGGMITALDNGKMNVNIITNLN